jgi:1-acyl-sn-glycerol-3-phosphate acyltransferase
MAALALHLFAALAVAALVYSLLTARWRQRLKAGWSAGLLAIVGIDRRVVGEVAPGALLVANHVSWLDIFVINAAQPTAFVAKSEIRRWPLAGWLCQKTDTLFIERGSRRHAQHVAHAMAELLTAGRSVTVFPEGTTSDGHNVLPFHAALLQPAISLQVPVQPLAIRYRDGTGARSAAPAYIGELSFIDSLRSTLAVRGLVAELVCLPQAQIEGHDRRSLTNACETMIRDCINEISPRRRGLRSGRE